MVRLVFLINRFTRHDWKSAFLFAMAAAVGLTPEMLPMIVSVLSLQGRARHQPQESDSQAAQRYPEVRGHRCFVQPTKPVRSQKAAAPSTRALQRRREGSAEVLLDGYLVSHFQTGFKNLLDRAILERPTSTHKQRSRTTTRSWMRSLSISPGAWWYGARSVPTTGATTECRYCGRPPKATRSCLPKGLRKRSSNDTLTSNWMGSCRQWTPG